MNPHRNPPSAVLLLTIFAVTLGLALVLIALLVPRDAEHIDRAVLGDKLDHLRGPDARYDTIIVGNSRAHHAIDPRVVDAVAARRGCPMRSYNLAAPALSKLEFDWLLTQLPDLPAGQPKRVITVDVAHLSVGLVQDFDLRHRLTFRPGALREAYEYRAHLPAPFYTQSRVAPLDTAAGIAAAQPPLGRVYQRMFTQSQNQDFDAGVATRGYAALETLEKKRIERARDLREENLAAGTAASQRTRLTPNEQQLADWMFVLRAHTSKIPEGSRGYHVLIPSKFDPGTAAAVTARWQRDGDGTPLINLIDPELLPGMTSPDFWFDADHVTRSGAIAVSSALGRALCPGPDGGVR